MHAHQRTKNEVSASTTAARIPTRHATRRYLDAERTLSHILGNEEVTLAEVIVCIASVHADRAEYAQALERYFDALDLYARSGASPLVMAAQYRRIADVYRKQVQM